MLFSRISVLPMEPWNIILFDSYIGTWGYYIGRAVPTAGIPDGNLSQPFLANIL